MISHVKIPKSLMKLPKVVFSITYMFHFFSRRSAGGIMDLSELDPVEELPAEHLEDSP